MPARVKGPTDHVVIVGAGYAGLSAALRLAGAGRKVTVIERESVPGHLRGGAAQTYAGDVRLGESTFAGRDGIAFRSRPCPGGAGFRPSRIRARSVRLLVGPCESRCVLGWKCLGNFRD